MQNIYFSDDHTFVSEYNYLCLPTIHLLRKERINFHAECCFRYNILALVTEQEQNAKTAIRCPLCKKVLPFANRHFYFIPAGHKVRYDIFPDSTYYTIHTGFEYFPGVDLFSEKDPCIEGDAEEMIQKMDQIWQEHDPMKQACRLREMLLNFYLLYWPQKLFRKTPAPSMLQTLNYINDNCSAMLSVEELADRINLNVDIFSRKFKRDFGISPKKYISQIVFRKICGLLQNKELTLDQIAAELHFSSGFYLSRFIKQQCGVPPAIYRRRFYNMNPEKGME